MNVRITHIDGSLPNLALMALSAFHRAKGDEIHFTRDVERGLFEPEYGVVYGSCVFNYARHRADRLAKSFPNAIIGGTGMFSPDDSELVRIRRSGKTANQPLVTDITGHEFNEIDYSIYPDFTGSIGFTQRGCRLRCGFCVVPWKEGKNVSVGTINQIWRGEGYPKHIHLLDNDFFGQDPVQWALRCNEMITGGFKVCFSQGINVRLINPAVCVALRNLDYRDDAFKVKRLYTAWDNIGDEKIFFGGVDILEDAGIPPTHLMAYMLVGYDKEENWDRIWHRFNRMVERGINPYPMVFDKSRRDLVSWARWVLTGLYRFVKWDEYKRSTKSVESIDAYTRSLA